MFDTVVTGILAYEFMSKLARGLFSMFKLLILLRKSPEFLMYVLLVEPKKRYGILGKYIFILWGAIKSQKLLIIEEFQVNGFLKDHEFQWLFGDK